ncbi:hypothetical protein KSP39_PZI010966 [Platanthera zijinensis]|uniref:Peptide N-acetyl-beta-D-glucosaminyl asparaginase amidase A N-terminal domain-containing protein n=1 Tax=Platanthera zijinensis TaxID=2320716 RepID=A0AAP0BGM4_9ASPA
MDNLLLILFLILSFSYCSGSSTSSLLHSQKLVISGEHEARLFSATPPQPPPITFFEVQRPIPLPKSRPCSTLVLQHDFAYTYGKPPVTSAYSPPSHCPLLRSSVPSTIVLEWSAACSGVQFDRIFGVWLAGVELLRGCTAEPIARGINWSVRKDVTRYASLFQSPSDVIIPISKSLPLNDGLWFQIHNSSDVQGKGVKIPRNVYRAVIEVYVSFHSDDEFWYTNPENNLTSVPGNGAFREVTVRLDDAVVGAIWPFTVIYTGGVNPLFWRPISAIGSFNLPTYDIEITPFLGKLLDGKKHFFGFGVTNSLNVWFIDANLHLWVDKNSYFTEGKLINHEAPVSPPSLVSQFKDLDGQFDTLASRKISSTGWVKSSYGKITTHFFQNFNFTNKMKFSGNGSIQEVNQSIDYNHGSYSKDPSSVLYYERVFQSFPLYLYIGAEDEVNDSIAFITNVTLGNNEKKISRGNFGPHSFSNLRNSQSGQGIMHVKENMITGGIASTQQVYKYEGTDGCYFRKVGSNNYTILHDESKDYCTKSSQIGS